MPKLHSFWIYLVLASIGAYDLVFGPGDLLKAGSVAIGAGFALLAGAIALAAIFAFAWISFRDALADLGSDRRAGLPWRWRFAALVGVAGTVADGTIGAWSAYRGHITFATAVNALPLAGIPLLLVLVSYPLWQIESWLHSRTADGETTKATHPRERDIQAAGL